MQKLIAFINEDLDENFLWLLDKWFETNEDDASTFIGLILNCKQNNSYTVDSISNFIKGTHFEETLKEFVSFINNDISKQTTDKDILYDLKKIVEATIANKTPNNKYNTKKDET